MSFLDWSRSQRKRTTTRFVDPEDHARPTRLRELIAYRLLDPFMARLQRLAVCGLCASAGLYAGIWNGYGIAGSVLIAVLGWVIGYPVGLWYLALVDAYRERRHPRGAQLAQTAEGLILLQEGEGLHARRHRLTDGQDGTDEQMEAHWQDHLELERELRERQNHLLADKGLKPLRKRNERGV